MTATGYSLTLSIKHDISQETTASSSSAEHVFLWQHYNFPFGYPHSERTFNTKDGCVDDIVTFPPELTHRLLEGKSGHATGGGGGGGGVKR